MSFELNQLREEVKVLKKRLDRLYAEPEQSQLDFGLIPVTVVTDGGSAGSATVECSYTYTVRNIEGIEIGTGVSLSTSRHIVSAMNPATHGIAWITSDKTVVLWWCDEQEQTEVCT